MPFILGVTATFTFVFTVVLPVTRKEIIPVVSPKSVVKVEAELITDAEGGVHWLENKAGTKMLVLRSAPMKLKVSNLSEYPLIVDEVLLHFNNALGRKPLGPPEYSTAEWHQRDKYTGSFERTYDTFIVNMTHAMDLVTRSIFAEAVASSESELAKHKHVSYNIPPFDTDIVALELRDQTSGPGEVNYELTFELRCISRGTSFSYTYKPPFNFATVNDEHLKLFPVAR